MTKSCFDALLAIKRRSRSDQLVWIDQLSIDQRNLNERSAQVLLMSNIYAGAEQVLIWLDEFENLTCRPVDARDLRDDHRHSKGGILELHWSTGIRTDCTRPEPLQQEAKNTIALIEYLCKYYSRHTLQNFGTAECPASDVPTSIKAWDHLLAILRHRYFQRRWILRRDLPKHIESVHRVGDGAAANQISHLL